MFALGITLTGFLAFIKSAIFVVGYIQSSNLFPEPLTAEEEKIYLVVYDKNNILIERESFWSFELLHKKLECKLKYLAFVSAKKLVKNGKIYFYYYDIQFMKLKNFYVFLELVKIGKIDVYFKYGVYRSGARIGKPCDHGTSFNINRNDLDKLFSRL